MTPSLTKLNFIDIYHSNSPDNNNLSSPREVVQSHISFVTKPKTPNVDAGGSILALRQLTPIRAQSLGHLQKLCSILRVSKLMLVSLSFRLVVNVEAKDLHVVHHHFADPNQITQYDLANQKNCLSINMDSLIYLFKKSCNATSLVQPLSQDFTQIFSEAGCGMQKGWFWLSRQTNGTVLTDFETCVTEKIKSLIALDEEQKEIIGWIAVVIEGLLILGFICCLTRAWCVERRQRQVNSEVIETQPNATGQSHGSPEILNNYHYRRLDENHEKEPIPLDDLNNTTDIP